MKMGQKNRPRVPLYGGDRQTARIDAGEMINRRFVMLQ